MLSFIKRHHLVFISIVFGLLSLQLISTDRRSSGGGVIVRETLALVTRPIESAVLSGDIAIRNVWTTYIGLIGVKKENDKLKKIIAKTIEENNKLKEETILNTRLKELIKFKEDYPSKLTTAEIIRFSPSDISGNWTRTITMNKGSVDGIAVNMAVISPYGLVGRVIETTSSTSTVLLLTDARSNVDVMLQRTRIKSIIEGGSNGGTILKYIRHGADITAGDVVITSGISPIFSKGLIVGEVITIEKGSDSLFQTIEVRPSVDIKNLEYAFIITELGNIAHEPKHIER